MHKMSQEVRVRQNMAQEVMARVMHNTSQEVMGHAQHGTRGKGHADTEQHKQHIYHSTNKHSLSQDGSSDTSPKRWGISAPYCAHTPNTDTAISITSRMWELPRQTGAFKEMSN